MLLHKIQQINNTNNISFIYKLVKIDNLNSQYNFQTSSYFFSHLFRLLETASQQHSFASTQKMENNEYIYSEPNLQSQSAHFLQQQLAINQRLRRQAYNRQTDYVHPRVQMFDHGQIDFKQSEQLKKELLALYKPKIQAIRSQVDKEDLAKDYEKVYEEFISMTVKNQVQQRQLTQSIGEMHQMADILLNKDNLFGQHLFLYDKKQPSEFQQEEINSIFDKYQLAYKQSEGIQENTSEQVIKRAKQFLRDRYN